MSTKYPGGFITKSPVAPTSSAASGIWTLDQQQQAQKAGTWPSPPPFIEDVFSTYLYSGDGSSAQNINNGIDLAGKGGMVWVKSRSNATTNVIVDTNRFVSSSNIQCIFSDSTAAASASADEFGSFNSNGFSIPYNTTAGWTNFGTRTFVSWSFRKQAKFFDIVLHTSGASLTLNHALGVTPGFIMIKETTVGNWFCFHRSSNGYLQLNTTAAAAGTSMAGIGPTTAAWIAATSTTIDFSNLYSSSSNFVAYLYAHDAGGFGLTGTDNVISCGSFTTDGSGSFSVNLGYEPQWLMIKSTNNTGVSAIRQNWLIYDNMRGLGVQPSGSAARLFPNLSNAESSSNELGITATGFESIGNQNPSTGPYIYIAIRRGPMKVPTVGTSVYQGVSRTGTSANATVTGAGFAPDLTVIAGQSNSSGKTWTDKLRGPNKALLSAFTNSEQTTTDWVTGFTNTGFTLGADAAGADYVNKSPNTYINWMFGRAPSFFDEVCYTGTGANRTVAHNLGAVPELMIVKQRGGTTDWVVYAQPIGNTALLALNLDIAQLTFPNGWNNTSPTSTEFTVGISSVVNASGGTYVAYLFSTCAGVSKVGSYTGTGALQTVNCGFTSGARFVLIKRTDSTGDWWTYDSARGITSGNDPYLYLNTTDPENTGTNYVDTDTTGFKVTAAAPAGLNANGGTYIFLAIA
jgi:hypothetical protein